MFLHHFVRWPFADVQVKFYGDRPRGTPSPGELNTRCVAEYNDFGPIKRYISETCKIDKFVLSINRKWYMSFRLVPNDKLYDLVMTLNGVGLIAITGM